MIIDYKLEYGEPIIYHWYRKGKKKVCNRIVGFSPYFYVEQRGYNATLLLGTRAEIGYKSLFGEPLVKIITRRPSDVGRLRQDVNYSYEADVLYEKRYLIDNVVEYGDLPKVMYWDIEVLNERGVFPEPTKVEYPIISISLTSNYDDFYITLLFDKKHIGIKGCYT